MEIKMKKIIITVISTLVGAALGAGTVEKIESSRLDKAQCESNKHLILFKMMNQWVKVKQDGKNLSEYFIKNDYRRIAIFGMHYAGETLLNELRNTEVEVVYGIDKNADALYMDVDIVSTDDNLDTVDAVVVTAIAFFGEIEEMLSTKVDCPILSLEDILYQI